MGKWNILVFPCGSEIGLEIHRSLKYSNHVNLIGASSVDDHGRYVYGQYFGGMPFLGEMELYDCLKRVIAEHDIHAVYPTMDQVIVALKPHEKELGCKVIAPNVETASICASKSRTYAALSKVVKCPHVYATVSCIDRYPVFIKPDKGYGSRGAIKVDTPEILKCHLDRVSASGLVIMEYLPGDEYTVDCFTDRHERLLFCGARKRSRIVNGISVHTNDTLQGQKIYHKIAQRINRILKLTGSWFVQLKRDKLGQLVLIEVACRLGGSSSLYRVKGVNFALLNVFDAFDVDVDIILNDYAVSLDRALNNRYICDVDYDCVYVDYDDCLVINGAINLNLVKMLYQCVNQGKDIILLTKHAGDLSASLKQNRLEGLFTEVVHLAYDEKKSKYIKNMNSIFIDDAYRERSEVAETCGIPVFSPDMIECLIH